MKGGSNFSSDFSWPQKNCYKFDLKIISNWKHAMYCNITDTKSPPSGLAIQSLPKGLFCLDKKNSNEGLVGKSETMSLFSLSFYLKRNSQIMSYKYLSSLLLWKGIWRTLVWSYKVDMLVVFGEHFTQWFQFLFFQHAMGINHFFFLLFFLFSKFRISHVFYTASYIFYICVQRIKKHFNQFDIMPGFLPVVWHF